VKLEQREVSDGVDALDMIVLHFPQGALALRTPSAPSSLPRLVLRITKVAPGAAIPGRSYTNKDSHRLSTLFTHTTTTQSLAETLQPRQSDISAPHLGVSSDNLRSDLIHGMLEAVGAGQAKRVVVK